MGHTSPSSLRRLGPPRLRRAVMAIGVVSASVLAGMTVHSPAAQAWPTANVTILGHGFGHGRGMGQWGAYGYATKYGWTYQQILAHYYGGTKLVATATPSVKVNLSAREGGKLRVTSSSASFKAGGVLVPAGRAITLTYRPSTNNYLLQQTASCSSSTVVASSVVTSGVVTADTAPGSVLSKMLTFCSDKRTYRGSLALVYSGGSTHVVNTAKLEDYVRGVVPRESSPSWGDAAGGKGMAALEAQAVAARSYVLVQHRYSFAGICDTTSCQVYGGAGLNGSIIEDPRTNTAVTHTAGKRLIDSAGSGVSAEYSASTGGWTAGGQFPAVADLGDVAAPQHNWSVTVPASQLAGDFDVGTLTSITVLKRNGFGADGGRVESIQISGSAGTSTVTGFGFQAAEGLMSDWFSIATAVPTGPRLGFVYSATTRVVSSWQTFGVKDDIPIACDWDGNGRASGGVYRPSMSTFSLRDALTPSAPVTSVRLGVAGDLPVCGDWDGDGTQTVGVYHPATGGFTVLNANETGAPPKTFRLGTAGDVPVAGDWTGSGKDTVGVYRPSNSTFYLIDSNSSSAPRHAYPYGSVSTDPLPIVGDWDGNGTTTLGLYHDKGFYLSNTFAGPSVIRTPLGGDGCTPIAGDWFGTGATSIGIACSY